MSLDNTEVKKSRCRKVMDWLIDRYSLESDIDVWLVLLLFSITGSSSVRFGDPILHFIGFEGGYETFSLDWWKFVAVRLPLIFVIYQLLFLFYGFIIGLLRKSVWGFTKLFSHKMVSRFGIKILSDDEVK